MPDPVKPQETAVFLNVPFDSKYEPLLIALIAALVPLGRVPRCVLEIPEHGQGRLNRILDLMQSCAVSIHDLSRTRGRFNMPFELGLAYAIRHLAQPPLRYEFVILETKPHRIKRTLSDVSALDELVHQGKPRKLIGCVLDTLGTGKAQPSADEIYGLWRRLMKASRRLKKEQAHDTIYSAALFKHLVGAALELAILAKFIPPN